MFPINNTHTLSPLSLLLRLHWIFIFTNWFINKSLYRTTNFFSNYFQIITHMPFFIVRSIHFKRISIDTFIKSDLLLQRSMNNISNWSSNILFFDIVNDLSSKDVKLWKSILLIEIIKEEKNHFLFTHHHQNSSFEYRFFFFATGWILLIHRLVTWWSNRTLLIS